MKWKEFESKHPKELYSRVRQLCEEIHNEKGGRFCNYCYKREGWYCFPCKDIRKLYRERFGEPLEESTSRKKS
ncbi:MAG: hypothetical protein ACTSSA_09455 [Candidatus Freyarchaeota archaeon]